MKNISTPQTTQQKNAVNSKKQDGEGEILPPTSPSDPYARNDPRRISLIDSMEKQFEQIFGSQCGEK